ncbi:MAG TPA: hypothetical protein VMV94_10505 [Phycisphaerae bacterium]|nr:hypothetical protein [Phycisphaerae bacterium]
MTPLCQIVVFLVNVAQALINIYVLIMNTVGITTPDMPLPIGSLWGCNV